MKLHKRLLGWYFSKQSLPYWCVLLMDSAIIFLSGFLTYWLFYRGLQTLFHSYALVPTMLLYVLLSWVGMRAFYTYAGILRYSSFVDLRRVVYANVLSFFLAIGVHYALYMLPNTAIVHLSSRMLLVTYLIATALMCGVRVLMKTLYEQVVSGDQCMKCLIYGTMQGGVALAKSIRMQQPVRFALKGFITHESHRSHDQLMGVPIYSPDDDLGLVIGREKIDAVLVSPLRTWDFSKEQELQNKLIGMGVRIFMAQSAVEIDQDTDGAGDIGSVQLKEVSVEDLLPRDEIKLDMEAVSRELTGKRILITGSAGSIGSEIVRQVATFSPAELMLIDQAETPQHDIRLMMAHDYPDVKAATVVTSICDRLRMESVFDNFRPDYVFHAAAYKHVPMMEDNPSEAVKNNIVGTRVMADLSDKYGVKKFVMVSTDKAVNPTNVMGCSKRICEIYVQSLDKRSSTQFVTTRFGNVLGSNGSVIPLFKEQIKSGGPVTVTHPDITRYFMLIPEACKLVLEAGTKGQGGEIFVFDMGKPVRIADLADRMIKMSKVTNVHIEYTGLRPGEKLYEEVLNQEENTLPSFHEKIRIAKVREYDYDKVSRDMDELVAIAKRFDDLATVKKMKEMVPEFKSNNSVYECLDH